MAACRVASRLRGGAPGERKQDAVAFLLRVVAFFGRQGVKISQLVTDNGGCYRSKRFRRTLRELGIGHIFTRPYTPRTNGKVERFIAPRSWSGPAAGPTPTRACGREFLRIWLDYHNLRRRHTAIGRLTPMQRLVELRITNVLGIYSQCLTPVLSSTGNLLSATVFS